MNLTFKVIQIWQKKIFFLLFPFLLTMSLSLLLLIYSNRIDLAIMLFIEAGIIYGISLSLNFGFRMLIWIIYVSILGIQVSSVFSSGYYIVPLTISNTREVGALGKETILILLSIFFAFFLSSFIMGITKIKLNFSWYRYSLICLFVFSLFAFPTPLSVFCQTLFSYYKQISYQPSYNYPELSKQYLKVGIWNSDNSEVFDSKDIKNVIVIFTEGMSSSVIDSVNKKGLNVTPNLNKLYKNSVVFNNYYNHTAATFRGLRGQLTSAYQFKDGVNDNEDGFAQISNEAVVASYSNRLVSLPEILNRHGFRTYFLASTERNSTLNTMLKSMSFSKVYGMGDFKFYQNDRMTDKQTFTALKNILATPKDTPFFIGVYPSGTHHGRDSANLKYHDGKNQYYNKFFDYDAQLGEFIKYFDNSKYAKNTLLIVTSDHSTFPTPEFKNSFGIEARYFVDQIPFIVYKKGIQPLIINAQGSNSLSLTPTLLQILGINNEPNYFLGCSLLDKHCKSKFSKTSVIGDAYYVTESSNYPVYGVKEIKPVSSVEQFYNISG